MSTTAWALQNPWLAEVGAWMQTASGLTLLIEVIGKGRFMALGTLISALMSRFTIGPSIRWVVRFSIAGLKAQIWALTGGWRGADVDEYVRRLFAESKTIGVVTCLVGLFSTITVIIFFIFYGAWTWHLLWLVPLTHYSVTMLNSLIAYVTIAIFCIGALTVLVVLGGGVEGFCRLTVFILSKKGLVWALNALALLLLIAGSILRIVSA